MHGTVRLVLQHRRFAVCTLRKPGGRQDPVSGSCSGAVAGSLYDEAADHTLCVSLKVPMPNRKETLRAPPRNGDPFFAVPPDPFCADPG